MSAHKHRKGFREDQVVLSEAYGSIYNENDFAAGLENPSYGTNYIEQAIKAGQIKVTEVEGIDPNENRQVDAYISKAYIQEGDDWRELTDEEYDYINDYQHDFIDTAVQAELPWGREDQETPIAADEEHGSIQDLFAQRVERIGDQGDAFDVSDFEDLKPYIANWDTLLEIIDEENTQGFSERWEEVKFNAMAELASDPRYSPRGMRPEDAEGPGPIKQSLEDLLTTAKERGEDISKFAKEHPGKFAAGAGAAGLLGGSLVGHALSKRKRDDDDEKEEDFEDAEGELSDDWTQSNYRGDQHDFQPGEIVEVGPWGENDEYDHLEVVLQIRGDVVNTIPITDDAYGVQYGGRGGYDISLIRPQSEIDYDHGDFKPADGREW